MVTSLPDTAQLEQMTNRYLAWLLDNKRSDMIRLLNTNGVITINSSSPDRDIEVAVIKGIKDSPPVFVVTCLGT
jgi:hypothetical protein